MTKLNLIQIQKGFANEDDMVDYAVDNADSVLAGVSFTQTNLSATKKFAYQLRFSYAPRMALPKLYDQQTPTNHPTTKNNNNSKSTYI